MSTVALDLRSVKGFLVADARGRVVGRVESPMYGTAARTSPTRSPSAPASCAAAGSSPPRRSARSTRAPA